MDEPGTTIIGVNDLQPQILQDRDALVTSLRELVQALEGELGAFKSSFAALLAENELLKRRLFGAKSERTNTSEFQLLLDKMLGEDPALQKELEAELAPGNGDSGKPADNGSDEGDECSKPAGDNDASGDKGQSGDNNDKGKAPPTTPKGRRNLATSKLPRITVDIDDPELAKTGRLIGYEETFELLRLTGGFRVLAKRTARYEIEVNGDKTVLSAEQPQRLFPRSLCHTSVYAWLAVQKFALGVPCYRLEQLLRAEEESLDRGTMCRYLKDLGATLASTVVHAMFEDAKASCHVLSTDATGAAIQPEPAADGRRQACKRGHFFTIVADCDHVLYHYTESHSSKAVQSLFQGFSGLLQSDASSVYDVLERGPPDPTDDKLTLVGCWSHCRRYFFDAAITKHRAGVEGLRRIREIFRIDAEYAKLPPKERKVRRAATLTPLFDAFFAWVDDARISEPGRSLATKALGYAHNQEHELRRVLLDGRLPLDRFMNASKSAQIQTKATRATPEDTAHVSMLIKLIAWNILRVSSLRNDFTIGTNAIMPATEPMVPKGKSQPSSGRVILSPMRMVDSVQNSIPGMIITEDSLTMRLSVELCSPAQKMSNTPLTDRKISDVHVTHAIFGIIIVTGSP